MRLSHLAPVPGRGLSRVIEHTLEPAWIPIDRGEDRTAFDLDLTEWRKRLGKAGQGVKSSARIERPLLDLCENQAKARESVRVGDDGSSGSEAEGDSHLVQAVAIGQLFPLEASPRFCSARYGSVDLKPAQPGSCRLDSLLEIPHKLLLSANHLSGVGDPLKSPQEIEDISRRVGERLFGGEKPLSKAVEIDDSDAPAELVEPLRIEDRSEIAVPILPLNAITNQGLCVRSMPRENCRLHFGR
jgi:hypothetical protein